MYRLYKDVHKAGCKKGCLFVISKLRDKPDELELKDALDYIEAAVLKLWPDKEGGIEK